MTDPEFFFALEFSSQGAPASFLEELTSYVLGHIGCARDEVPELTVALEHALGAGTRGERRCDVQFSVRNRMLKILVSSNGGPVWTTTRPIR